MSAATRAPGSTEVTAIRTPARRVALALVALALATSAAVVAPMPAGAESSTVSGSWFFAGQPDPLPPPVGSPAAVPTPDVPSGDFAVSAVPAPPGQQSNKESYFHVDVSAASPEATLTGMTVKLKEDPAGGNLEPAAATIEARLVTEFFADGGAGAPYSQRPKFDTTAAVKGVRGGDGTWTFDVGTLVQGKAVSSFFGIAAIPAPKTPGDGFEVVWAGASATATYTVSGSTSSTTAVAGGFGAPLAGSDSGSGSSSTGGGSFLPTPPPSVSTSSGSSSSSGSISSGSSGSVSEVASAPVASDAGSTAAPVGAAPAASTKIGKSDHGIPWTFIPAALAVLALLVAAAVALGQAGEPVPERQGSVVRRLERPLDAVS